MIDKISFTESGPFKQFVINERLIESCTEYLDYIFYIQNMEEKHTELWFRGVSDIKFDLVPRMHRIRPQYDPNLENNLLTKFVIKAKPFLKHSNYTRFEWIHLMQHYGLPTRLLDWTEGALIGLFFAIRFEEGIKENIPCVWVLNPGKLNGLATGKSLVFVTDNVIANEEDEVVNDYLNIKDLPLTPIAISPSYIDSRIQAQKSVFTIHGKNYNDIMNETISERMKFYQLRINNKCADRIKKQLQILGIDESTLFPDLEGISRELTFKYEIGKVRWHMKYEKL